MGWFSDRYLRRFVWGGTLIAISGWGMRIFDGIWTYAFLLPFVVGLIASLSGMAWIGAVASVPDQSGSVESRFPAGHVIACLVAAAFGLVVIGIGLFGLNETQPVGAAVACMILGVSMFVYWAAVAFHCASFRILLKDGAVSATGGLRPGLRKGPYELAELSQRKGVDLTDGRQGRYQLNFVRKRSIGLSARMTGTRAILVAAHKFYPHDYMWDNCLLREKDARTS